MPFEKANFKSEYTPGDLFYGQAGPRNSFMKKIVPAAFQGPAHGTIINQYDIGDIAHGAKLPPEQEAFAEHIRNHGKYSMALNNEKMVRGGANEDNKKLWRRKSKAGLSWAATVPGKTVHFCLDGYEEYVSVVHKQFDGETNNDAKNVPFFDKSRAITNAELRWIYRNRDVPAVAETIQFWRDGKPCCPPWVGHAQDRPNEDGEDRFGSEEVWKLYKPAAAHVAADHPYGGVPFEKGVIDMHLYPIDEGDENEE